ncbi:MAG: GNAT family N-acetyltransferase [Oceanihabitans sp.]
MIQILQASTKHIELLVKIGKQTFIDTHGNSASKEDIYNFILKTYNKKAISKEFENPNIQYHIIYYNKIAAGFSKIELNISNKNINKTNITKLDRIYLLKEFFGYKLGLKLLEYNIQISKKRNQKGIWLAVWVENERAINFYTKAGFKIVGKYNFRISKTHTNPNHIMYLKYL